MLKKSGFLLTITLLLSLTPGLAQLTSSDTEWYNPMQEEVVELDPNTGSYYFYKLEGGKKGIPYKIMSAEEFSQFQQQSSMRDTWIERRNSTSSQDRGRQSGGGLIPSMRVDSDVFGQIFGGNEITITPQGSAEVIFGINNTYTDNPMIPSRYRSSTSFDFDTKLQFNIAGNIGERLKLNFNYDTEATFDFEQEIKLQYIGGEDDILQKIEAGNVSLPLSGSLITGSQSLFGIKTELKFGKLYFTGIVSQQKSESKEIVISGGSQNRTFEIQADEYDANRHFFLSQTFKDNYDKSLRNLPRIESGIAVTKIEVWVTNKTTNQTDSRNIVAFLDMGEPQTLLDPAIRLGAPPMFPDNKANNLFLPAHIDSTQIRNISNVTSYLTGVGYTGGEHYEKLENARKLVENVDYVVNKDLGYISLTTALNHDEILAVAYEYVAYGKTYKVGEFTSDGTIAPNALLLKLIRGTIFSPSMPNWHLMMKNVYSLDTYGLSKENFYLDVYYQDSKAGTDLPYITESAIANQPLIRVLNLDNLNSQNDPYPDGQFDFVEGLTVISSQGKIIFPVLQPFGSYLKGKINNPTIADKYIYQELYDSTLNKAQEFAEKNKFKLMGSYQSEISSEISLNAYNIPEGSVVVTAGSVKLQEGIDYIVNYTMGTIRIINPGYLESNTPIKVSVEDRGLFSMIQKTMYGANLNYQFSKDFNIGATILGLHERPLTQKVAFGDDPMSNIIWGMNISYRTESNFLTKMVDKLPFIDTKAPSQISFDAEFAQLLPGQSKMVGGKTFIDDFEGTQTSTDLRSWTRWRLSSTPAMFPEHKNSNNLNYGFHRSKLAWYQINNDFLRNTSATPAYIRANPDKYQKSHFVREIPVQEIYPQRDLIAGQSTVIVPLNLAYYPTVRGPYNYQISPLEVAPDGLFINPRNQWGGIMRDLTETDFEAANYEYIEFWLMDPFVYNPTGTGGDLYINLGNISEDILKDGYKFFENGLPTEPFDFTSDKIIETAWGVVPKQQSLTFTFDNNVETRNIQDVGFDGLSDALERQKFAVGFLDQLNFLNPDAKQKLENDPSSDNYRYYFDSEYAAREADILECYSDFNGPEGNSRTTSAGGDNTMATHEPDFEDINKDNTMNEVDSYFQYRIRITPQDLVVGQNFIANLRTDSTRTDADGKYVTWYQFKVPISEYESKEGSISNFKSIRFMRLFLNGFQDTTYMRFATFDLVRSEWRRYNYAIIEGKEGLAQPELATALFDISVVNIEEDSNRTPIPYVLPPGTTREIDPSSYQDNRLNEQSMQLKVANLEDGEGRAAYKSTLFDFRKFRRLQMDIHAESVEGYPTLRDGDVSLFVRMGSDYRNNYYEYEIPLKVSLPGDGNTLSVWPEENFLNILLEQLTNLKLERNQHIKYSGGSIGNLYEKTMVNGHKIRVLGNPNLGTVRNVMIGVRNPARVGSSSDDGADKSVIVWVNEMRLTDADNKGGWAANARASATLADLGSVSVSGNIKTVGFGSLESRINDRLTDDTYQYDIVSNFELGKFFPDRWGVRVPLFFGFSEQFETPFYNPYDQDVKLSDALDNLAYEYQRDSLMHISRTYNRRKSFSLNNVRIAPEGSSQKVFALSNLSLSYSFNESFMRNMRTQSNLQRNFNGMLAYTYNVNPYYFEPFKKIGGGRALSLIRDFNIGLYPNQLNFTTDISRYYSEMQNRNVMYPEIPIPATYAKDFTWNRRYDLMWNLTRSLRLTYSATNLARIDEPEGLVNKSSDPNGYRLWKDEVWGNLKDFGRNTHFDQQFEATWQLPFSKIPVLDWVTASATYRTEYQWDAAPIVADSLASMGNIISNMQGIGATVNVGLDRLYNKSTFLRSINNKFDGNQKQSYGEKEVSFQSPRVSFTENRKRKIKHGLATTNVTTIIRNEEGQEVNGTVKVVDKNNVEITLTESLNNARVSVVGRVPKTQNPLEYAGELMLRLAMSVKTISFSLEEANSTSLPGFMPESQWFGQSQNNGYWAPGWGFIFGQQDKRFLDKAHYRGWMTSDTSLMSSFMMAHNQQITIRVEAEPIKDLKIRLNGRRAYRTNDLRFGVASLNGEIQGGGDFSISVISIASAFENPKAENGFKSKSYEKFLASRAEVAWLYANDRQSKSPSYNPGSGAYPNGYSEFSQEVLMGSFLSAYAGKSINGGLFESFPLIPMPNWSIDYTGLNRITALKSIIRSATLRHSYSSLYSIGSYSLNREYKEGSDGLSHTENALNDFIAYRDFANVAIAEELAPLAEINLEFQNSLLLKFSTNMRRRLGLSLSNNQILESRSKEYIFGIGYQFDNVPLLFNFDGSRPTTPSTLTLNVDFKIADNIDLVRKLDQTDIYNQISDGRRNTTLGFKADYRMNERINMALFFNYMLNNPYVSTFGKRDMNFGISVRVLFNQ